MKHILVSLILLGLGVLQGLSAHAEDQIKDREYSIFNVPKEFEGRSCSEWATIYGERLAAQHGVAIVAALCSYDQIVDSYRIVVRYRADAPLQLVSTYTFNATYDSKGAYANYEECYQAIRSESALFQEETGLQPFLSFCSHQRLTREKPWYVHIDAFGEAQRVPSRTSFRSGRPYGKSHAEIFEDLAAYFQRLDARLVHLVYRGRAVGGEMTVFYYGPASVQRQSLSGRELAELDGLPNCQTEADSLMRQLGESDAVQGITAYCSSVYSGPRVFDLTLVLAGMQWLDAKADASVFESIDSCREALPEILPAMRAAYGERFLAALCHKDRRESTARVNRYRVLAITTLR